jgi:hypothetical protein
VRIIDVVLGCVAIGLIVGLMQTARPATANAGSDARTTERMTWLWMPVMRRTSHVH